MSVTGSDCRVLTKEARMGRFLNGHWPGHQDMTVRPNFTLLACKFQDEELLPLFCRFAPNKNSLIDC